MRKIALVPVYNEANSLQRVLDRLGGHVDVIIAVNDGSTDDSSSILSRWVAGRPHSYVVDNDRNRGKASALKDGFAVAAALLEDGTLTGDDLLYTFDADGQHTVDSIDRLAGRMIDGRLDMLLTRRDFSHYPGFKKVGNWGLSLVASLLGGYKYHDVECGFRVLKLARVPEILSYYNGYKYSCEQELGIIAAGLGYRIDNSFLVEIPYYRAGTKVPDGLINVSLGLVAWARLHLGLRTSREALARRLLGRRILAGPGAPLPGLLASAASAPGAPVPAAPVPVKLDR